MFKRILLAFGVMFSYMLSSAQTFQISGKVVDAFTEEPIPFVAISLEDSSDKIYSGTEGEFTITIDPEKHDSKIIRLDKQGYEVLRLPVNIKFENLDMGKVALQPDPAFNRILQAGINLSEADLLADEGEFDNASGVLLASRDVFQNAAAFDFSQTFFRPRGLGSEYGRILINGIEMNKMLDGRPQWSNWGGLNDVQRNQVLTNGPSPAMQDFGSIGGITNIIMRASKFQKGGRLSLSTSNRSYTGRVMTTYSSGDQGNGWFYALSLGRRWAEEGYMDGTAFDGNSFFISVGKEINDNHSLNFTGIYTPNSRGRSAPVTEEVFRLKGRSYNPYWGFQNKEIRNSRMREIREPILILNHYWNVSKDLEINSNIAFQFGEVSNSRIDYGGLSLISNGGVNSYVGGGVNPDPAYYQYLPSYHLRFPDNPNFEAAFRAQNELRDNGQLNWQELYSANQTAREAGLNSVYVLAEDVTQENTFKSNFNLNWRITDNLEITSGIRFDRLRSENFARLKDLLGGSSFLDLDIFLLESDGSRAQNDLLNPNRQVLEGERYKYSYSLNGSEASSFLGLRYTHKRYEGYLAGNLGTANYSRDGLYLNGAFPERSLGESENVNFFTYGIKSGGLLKISGRQTLEGKLAALAEVPALKNIFINPRQNNIHVPDIKTEKILSGELSYRYRFSRLNLRVSGYYSRISDITEVSYYFAEGISGLEMENNSAFVQEILTDMEKTYYGLEFGSEAQLTTTIKLKAVLSLGEYIFSNNPELTLHSAGFNGSLKPGRASLKNYHLPGGPQTAAQLGFEYRDPDFWWFSSNINYFADAYLDVNPLSRTANFSKDFDGLPLVEYDPQVAKTLLKQERFDDYFLVNATGGKSWRLKDKYLNLFISLNNIFNKLYKSGGFEQARTANYRSLIQDSSRDLPLFSPKYWYGAGTSFFANISLRF